MPRNLTITINNSTSVTVTWDLPEMANGIIRNYTIMVFNNDTNEAGDAASTDFTTPACKHVYHI